MFADADLDIKKRAKSDSVLASMIQLSSGGFFEENFDILASVFHEKGMNKGDHHEIAKTDFIQVLKDSGILIIQKVEAKPEETKGGKAPAKQEGK